MKNNKPENNSSSNFTVGYIVIAVLFVGLVIGVGLMIPRLHLPSKAEKNEITADKPIPDGTVQNGGLWEYYKDKTLTEVKSLRPGIIDTGNGLFLFDQYGDSERAVLFGGSYENDKLYGLSLILSNSDSLCGATSEADKKILSDFSEWCIDKLGFSINDMEYMESGGFVYYTDYANGIRCTHEICPGEDIKMFGCADMSTFAEYEGW
ncbi:MAG: hypothetical protein IJI14_17180 [Anaerolineaceae bacterium]|nr:hypothetical protein [Anaerolineaceae bacterium]